MESVKLSRNPNYRNPDWRSAEWHNAMKVLAKYGEFKTVTEAWAVMQGRKIPNIGVITTQSQFAVLIGVSPLTLRKWLAKSR